jgi:hypothetical protein
MKQIIVLMLLSVSIGLESKERISRRIVRAKSVVYKTCEARKKAGLDNKTRAILAQFASIVMGFLGIVQDPNNSANVTAHVTDMINNAVNIVTEAVKKGELSLHATECELQEFAEKTKRTMRV